MAKNIVQIPPEKFPWLDLRRYTFSMGCEKDGVLIVAGQTASTYDKQEGRVVCKGDIVEQSKVIWEKIGVVLEAAGYSYENLVKVTNYVAPVGVPKYQGATKVRRQYVGSSVIASTGMVAHDLLRPDAFLEVNAVAVKGKKEAVLLEGAEAKMHEEFNCVPAVKVGNKVWLAGASGGEFDPSGNRTYPRDAVQQGELCYQLLGRVLQAAGATFSDVVCRVDYVAADAALLYPKTERVRRAYFKGAYPAAGDVVVNRLMDPGLHVEVDLTAITGVPREEIHVPAWEKYYRRRTSVPAVKMGNLVYFSGQSSIDYSTGQSVTANGDVVAQGRKAYQNLAEVCATAGVSMDDIIYTVEYIPPMAFEGYKAINQVRREFFGDRFPAASGIIMHQVQRPELCFEVLAIAVV